MGLFAIEGSGIAGAGRNEGLVGSYRSPLRSPISSSKSSLFLPSAMMLPQKLMIGEGGRLERISVFAQGARREMADRVLQINECRKDNPLLDSCSQNHTSHSVRNVSRCQNQR